MSLQFGADAYLRLPRILCLHGGGSNAKIFRAQCRNLNARLKTHFRLVFVDAPFSSQPGPDVNSVYADWGPFRRWLRWTPDHPELSAIDAVAEIDNSLQRAIDDDDSYGATGEWIGLLGFSQGAKMSASLLFRQQKGTEKAKSVNNFRFAVLLAGRGPLVSLDPEFCMTMAFHDAAALSLGPHQSNFPDGEKHDNVLRIPTLHVHGLKDPGLEHHRQFLKEYCGEGSTTLIEWDGDHRVPLKQKDVVTVVEQILDLARETGVLRDKAHIWKGLVRATSMY